MKLFIKTIFLTSISAPCQFLDSLMVKMCESIPHLPVWAKARVAWIWAKHCQSYLKVLLESLQQIISCQAVKAIYEKHTCIEMNEAINNATRTMKILYYANILAGEYDRTRVREDPIDADSFTLDDEYSVRFLTGDLDDPVKKSTFVEDPLSIELNVSAMDSRQPLIPFVEFYNELLSDALEMDQDYLNYYNWSMRQEGRDFSGDSSDTKTSFMLYSFILTPAKKTLAMYFHSRIRMYSEGRINILNTHFSGQPASPYLKLKVRRDHLIEDALIELELIALSNPKDLKKQLVVEFIGEQGVDEGGVSKEFFQLIVEEIFNPEYGMFVHHEESEMFWINSISFENEAQFTLIGIVLGLAIYNNIILAVNFPMVVYRKLMGIKGSFADLKDWNPVSGNVYYKDRTLGNIFHGTFQETY